MLEESSIIYIKLGLSNWWWHWSCCPDFERAFTIFGVFVLSLIGKLLKPSSDLKSWPCCGLG